MTSIAEADSLPSLSPPFPGLRPFLSRDHEYFFGRDHQIHALYRLLIRNHFIAVVGSSGSGKSSIVRAGLLPKLDQDNRQAQAKVWQSTTMRPGREPINRLANALAKAHSGERDAFFEARSDRIAAMLRASSQGISEAVEHALPDKEAQLVLVVDQFEELFRFLSVNQHLPNRAEMSRRKSEAVQFVQLLLAVARNHAGRVRVIITMRSDFIGDCAWFQGLPEAVSAAQFLVPSLSKDQREEAIRKPIRKAGATIEPALVRRLLIESEDEFDQLPVLQHCLARLWMRAGSAEPPSEKSGLDASNVVAPSVAPIRHLTEQDYKDIGGLAGALSGHADEILAGLPGKERTVEQIFRALAEVDKEGRAIRRARPLAELIAETGADRADVCEVLDRFRADECSFAVPPYSQGPTASISGDALIDVGHEALLRRWRRVSGDPEATGERADKRDIGWLRQEQKDGERYQFLRSCVDPESSNESRLSDDQVRRYWDWWSRWKPNPAWAARYGGRFSDVERLIKTSNAASQNSRKRKRVTYAAAVGFAVVLAVGGLIILEQQRLAERTFRFAMVSAKKMSTKTLETFNSGQMTTAGAEEMQKVAAGMYQAAGELGDNSETSALRTAWLLADSDLEDALGRKDQARARASEAETYARKYLAGQPNDPRWQEFLYGSLFRIGDLDLDRFIKTHDRQLYDQAVGAYRESELISQRMLAAAIAAPKFELADTLAFADRRFDVAFAINKVGEAMQVREDIEGALKKFNEALDQAVLIESAPRMDCKLQSATTRIKIANALLSKRPGDVENALRNYSEAIAREEELFNENRTNNIVRSNLAAAYEGRASAYEQNGKFDLAFKGYADAVAMFARLVNEDARDTKWLERLARVHRKFGAALESYARSRGESLDRAIEQYGKEVTVRERLAEKEPPDPAWQQYLSDSRERLRRVQAMAATVAGKPSLAE